MTRTRSLVGAGVGVVGGKAMGNCWLEGGTAVGSKESEQAQQKGVPRTRPVAATLEASKERRDKVQLISSGLQ